MATKELRNANRYRVAALASFWWSGSDELVHSGQGTTRNISSSGALIEAGVCPPNGIKIHVELRLPRIKGSDHTMLLHGEGVVVRVQDKHTSHAHGQAVRFAVSVQFYPEKGDLSQAVPLATTSAYVN